MLNSISPAESNTVMFPAGLLVNPETRDGGDEITFENGIMSISSKAKLTLEQFIMVLEHLDIRVSEDVILNSTKITGLPSYYSGTNATRTLPIHVMSEIKTAGGSIAQGIVDSYLFNIADINRRNPVLDMIIGVPWDGVDRITQFFDLLTTENTEIDRAAYFTLFKKWLVQTVAMAHNANNAENAFSAEGCLVLQGPEGIGKTSLFRKLAMRREWFKEGVTLDVRNKDSIIAATSAWITELGELDATMGKKQSDIKGFLTLEYDSIRKPYARQAVRAPRHTSLCATVNPRNFLSESAGKRRWWVIPVTDIDLGTLSKLDETWLQQLWAQAFDIFASDMDYFRLSSAEQSLVKTMNSQSHTSYLPYEDEFRLAMDFNQPKAQWKSLSASELADIIGKKHRCIVKSTDAGHVMTKLMDEKTGIIRRRSNGSQLYVCPLNV